MGKCSGCHEVKETRSVLMNNVRGYEDFCIDCIIRFFKIDSKK